MAKNLKLLQAVINESEMLLAQKYQSRSLPLPAIPGKAVGLIGVRRAGKSTLLKQTWDSYGLSSENLIHLNFFDDRLLPFVASDFTDLIDAHNLTYPDRSNDAKLVLMLDEVQLTEGWELFVSRMLRRPNTEVFFSGSSARMLSKELASALRGRSLATEVYPFSFEEYCNFREIPTTTRVAKDLTKLMRALDDYLSEGGFPELLKAKPPYIKQIISEYLDVLLLRDVIERNSAKDPLELKDTMKLLLNQIAAPFSFNKLCGRLKSLGHKLTIGDVAEYISWFEDCFLFFSVPLFSPSKHVQMTNPRKLYCVDNALWLAQSIGPSEKKGQLLENVVFVHLRRQYKEIYYYKSSSGTETDFLYLDHTSETHLVQACYSWQHPETKKRELDGLSSAMQEVSAKSATIVVQDILREESVQSAAGIIRIVPAFQFLLEK